MQMRSCETECDHCSAIVGTGTDGRFGVGFEPAAIQCRIDRDVPGMHSLHHPTIEELPLEINGDQLQKRTGRVGIAGADDIDLTLRHRDKIAAFARERFAAHPWLEVVGQRG